jgi:hypothetical protein
MQPVGCTYINLFLCICKQGMSSRYRKYDSGAEKRKKRQRLDAVGQSQKGALERFLVRESANANVDDGHDTGDVGAQAPTTEIEEEALAPAPTTEIGEGHGDDTVEVGAQDPTTEIEEEAQAPTAEIEEDAQDPIPSDMNNSFQPDIFDPRTWNALDNRMVDILVQKGPKRDLSIEHGPRDKFSRRFSALSYTRVLANGEKCDREWLVYSKELDKVFCFCCKLLRKGLVRGQLANDGFSDWAHLGTRLKEHETSREHVTNMATWYDLRLRLQNNQTIDSVAQRELEKEKEHWRRVLLRILLIVKFLAEHNIAFRGTNCKLYQDNNGNFLGLVECWLNLTQSLKSMLIVQLMTEFVIIILVLPSRMS